MLLFALRLAVGWALALVAGPALAGDFAELNVLGFSPDGNYFAFEEHAITEDSDAFSNIYVIDTRTDAWVAGTPVRVRASEFEKQMALHHTQAVEDEDYSEDFARAKAMAAARPILTRHHIELRGEIIESHPIDASMVYELTPIHMGLLPTLAKNWSLSMSEQPVSLGSCDSGWDDAPRGFALALIGEDCKTRTLHRDADRIPKSRDCPFAYSISEIRLFKPKHSAPVLVFLIDVFTHGWGGPDRNVMAVTARLTDR